MKELSPALKLAKEVLLHLVNKIDEGECDENYVTHLISRSNAEANGYYDKDSFVNYDKAQKILNLSTRQKVHEVLTINKVFQQRINNQRVGFLRHEVEMVAEKLRNGKIK